jgi:hypothetical protein
VIKKLNEDSVGVSEVKGSCSVPVCLDRLFKRNTVSHDTRGHEVDVFGPADDESDVMNALNRAALRSLRKLVDREIIASGSQINVIWIGLPLHSHTKDVAVEVGGVANIADIESNVPKT